MNAELLERLETQFNEQGRDAAFESLIEELRSAGEYDALFHAMLAREKVAMGLSPVRPSSFDNIPEERQEAFENICLAAAREVGGLLIAAGNIPRAWTYFKTIGEPQAVRNALDQLDVESIGEDQLDEYINLCLYEGVNPPKGVEILLATYGTCNTVTSLDQAFPQFQISDRKATASLLIAQLTKEIKNGIQAHLETLDRKSEATTVRELMDASDELFANGQYHVDVSHLQSAVRLGRCLDRGDEQFEPLLDLVEYGLQLDSSLQYTGEPPFEDFYEAHQAFFHVIADIDREVSLDYFRKKIEQEPDEQDKPILCYVLVDLLMRCERFSDAAEAARPWLAGVEDSSGFSFADLCHTAGRMDLLKEVALERGDALRFVTAICEEG
ncbi:hypothetical protein [Calycomorphotria hydatis]|uniref:Uncharacterized protein n=1 Tax=Calycomorphotria hydatis TaxID=2528027 RepID=A0A517TDU2_9PLAN|nr:hypothetical protein [Calycomorphotria hydatis]QDT66536.1 hypothetical protein V22_38060 [Calycomorphotria hydatis]